MDSLPRAVQVGCQTNMVTRSVKHIYATSLAIISVMIVLGYEWDDLNDYIVKRPGKRLFS